MQINRSVQVCAELIIYYKVQFIEPDIVLQNDLHNSKPSAERNNFELNGNHCTFAQNIYCVFLLE